MVEIIRLNGAPVSKVPHPYPVLQVFHDGGVVIDRLPVHGFAQLLPVERAIAAGVLGRFHGLKVFLIEFRVEFAERSKGSAVRRHLRTPTPARDAGILCALGPWYSRGEILEVGVVTAANTADVLGNVRRSHAWSK